MGDEHPAPPPWVRHQIRTTEMLKKYYENGQERYLRAAATAIRKAIEVDDLAS